MDKQINLLITSVGRRTKLIEYFKKEFQDIGNIITTDCSEFAPALYTSDKYYIVPRIDNPNYINSIKEIIKKEKISGIFSLIDPELSLLAKHEKEFKSLEVLNILSSYETCELFLDKYKAYQFFKSNNINCAKTYVDFNKFESDINENKIEFPVFIKPQKGSASINLNKAYNMEEAKFIFNRDENMIVQEYLEGIEIGVDVYVDMISKKTTSIFIKEKISMRAGETDKSKSIRSQKILELITQFLQRTNLIGPIDIDVFKVGEKLYISEVNPRFGGGYPHAYECGINYPKYILTNLKNKTNGIEIENYPENNYMMKQDGLITKQL